MNLNNYTSTVAAARSVHAIERLLVDAGKVDVSHGTLPNILASVSTADSKRFTLWARRRGDPARTEIRCVQLTSHILLEIGRQ